MQLDAMMSGYGLRQVQTAAAAMEAAGFDGIWFTEGGRTAYLSCTAAALATSRLTIGTAVAVAFPRSPMVTAQVAWELADATEGRFVLGLGTQVRAHIERRYSSAYDHPGPRLREYTLALRAIWAAFQGDAPLDHRGEFYNFTMLGETWTGGRISHPDIPIYLAAVQPWMLRMCGEVADGLHVHPFHSRLYLDDIVVPQLAAGAEGAGRSPADVALCVPVQTIVADTPEERARLRETARFRTAFYGSTRSYSSVFDVHGHHGLADRLHALQRAGDHRGMASCITDDMLDHYAIECSWDELADRLVERYQGVAARLVMYYAGTGWREDPSVLERWAEVIGAFRAKVGRSDVSGVTL